MLIISKFHDYYDTAIGVGGIDKTCVFRRMTEEYHCEQEHYDVLKGMLDLEIDHIFRGSDRWNISFFTVLFCGRLYRGIKFTSVIYSWTSATYKYVDHCFYAYDKAFMNRFVSKKRYIPFLREYFKDNGSEIHKEKMVELEMPIVSYEWMVISARSWPGNGDMVIDPNLAELKFFKVYDPFSAFQEISMFIGNIATKGNDTVKIQDKDQIVKKGFDLSTSFRRPKGEKKPRRRKRKKTK